MDPLGKQRRLRPKALIYVVQRYKNNPRSRVFFKASSIMEISSASATEHFAQR